MQLVANWKAYVETPERAATLLKAARRLAKGTRLSIVLTPPAPYLGLLAARNKTKVAFAAQDISLTTGGAHTGEATAQMYKSVGATYAIIGHSERRAAGDTNEIVAQKMRHTVAHNLIPILCVGEQARDAEGNYLAFIREQLSAAFAPLPPKERTKAIVAYEPIWAIGKTAADAISADDLSQMTLYLRKVLSELYPGKAPKASRVLYGGSVEPENIRDLAGAAGVDGFLVGHASVDPDMFVALARALS